MAYNFTLRHKHTFIVYGVDRRAESNNNRSIKTTHRNYSNSNQLTDMPPSPNLNLELPVEI